MAAEEGIDDTQLLKGVLDLAVLAVLSGGANYGYAILTSLREAGHERVGEASVYGTLRRLAAQGAVSSRVAPSDSGPHRKYFELTERGRTRLRDDAKTWRRFTETMHYLLEDS